MSLTLIISLSTSSVIISSFDLHQNLNPLSLSLSLALSLLLSLSLSLSGSWKEKTFKPYNFEALGVAPDSGHLHPLLKVRTQFRQIFLEMG